MEHNASGSVGFGGEVNVSNGLRLGVHPANYYRLVARGPVKGPDGRLRRKCKWVEFVPNLVTTEGKNDTLTKYFKGSSYTAAWYVGLVNNSSFTAFAAGDTAAQINGTNQWIEATAYSESVRQTLTLGSASAGSIDNTASKAVFSINGTVTVHGAFVASNSTKTSTSGVLYGEAALSADRALLLGDTLTITVTLTQS